eukprot:1623115-Amphidinium_carterae.5
MAGQGLGSEWDIVPALDIEVQLEHFQAVLERWTRVLRHILHLRFRQRVWSALGRALGEESAWLRGRASRYLTPHRG